MALGIKTENGSGGTFIPIIKYDARAGRVARIDRSNESGDWVSEAVDITQNFKAVFDMENIEVGWMRFAAGSAPDLRLVPLGTDPGVAPSPDHKMGFRALLKLASGCGGDVRELCSSAKVAIGSFDELHDAYMQGAKTNAGKLPVVELAGVKSITSGNGAHKSTNYAPTWKIVSWVNRPADLQAQGAVASPTTAPAAPATGSTIAAPPPAPAPQTQSAEDFG